MTESKIPILLPIETVVRELDWKLDLAVRLANPKRQIYIGQHDIIHEMVARLSNGLYVGKNIFTRNTKCENGHRLAQLHSQGFTSVYIHEEGAVFTGNEEDWKTTLSSQYDPTMFGENDTLCTWGRWQQEFDMARGARSVRVMGHPKFDLYRNPQNKIFNLEAEKLSAKFGKIILINTNFSGFNHGTLSAKTRAMQKDQTEIRASQAADFYSMIALVIHLSERMPDRTVVLRPHPSEGTEIYSQMLSHRSNVRIERKGSLGAWLKAADCLIQNGCTTAIEAYFSGTPVLSYRHQSNSQYEIWLPNQIGDTATSPQEALNWIANLSQYALKLRNSDRVENLIDNFRGERLMDFSALCEDAAQNKKVSRQNFTAAERVAIRRARALQFFRMGGSLFGKQSTKYHSSKFPNLTEHEIQSRAASHSDAQGKPVCVTVLNPFLFSIKST